MAKGTVISPTYVGKLTKRLQRDLIGSEVSYQQVRGDRYRFVVVWNRFEKMGHPERQRMVWDIADEALPKVDLLKVAMIVTLAPSELPEASPT
jgi:hypothetical protein